MTPLDWTITVLITVLAIVFFALTFRASYNLSMARGYARRVGLALTPELEPLVAERLAQRGRVGTYGALAGLALGVLFLLVRGADDSSAAASTWLLLGAYFAGLAVAIAVWAIRLPSLRVDGPRIARTGAVGVPDYLSSFERNGARVCVALSIVVLAVAAILHAAGVSTGGSPLLSIGAIIVALGVASLVLFEFATRRILSRGQPAGTPTELAWDDALRAGTARDIVTAPLCLGLWSIVFMLSDSLTATSAPSWLLGAAALAVFAAVIVIASIAVAQKPQQHYLRRLWPDVASAASAASTERR
jgi:hypothetical protein